MCRPYRAYALTCPTAIQIYWNKRKCLHQKRVELPRDWFGKTKMAAVHCFGTPIWLPKRTNLSDNSSFDPRENLPVLQFLNATQRLNVEIQTCSMSK